MNSGSELLDAVTELVQQHDWVTFVQLARFLDARNIPSRGDVNLTMTSDRNVLLWSGMSAQMSELVLSLMDSQRIFAHRSSVAVYHLEGGVLALPLADEPTPNGLEKPHWLPVAFRASPPKWATH